MHSQKTNSEKLVFSSAPSTQVLLSSFERLRSWTETVLIKN
jgi:hypothetical protein